MDPDFLRGVQMGAFMEEDGEEDEFKCPVVPTPNILSWIDKAEPAKVALLQYANEGKPIPEIDMAVESFTRIFKIWTIFDKKYEADMFCRGYQFSKECTKIIFKFGNEQMEKKQKAEISSAKKSARANRRQARSQGKDNKSDHKSLRDRVD